MNVRDLPEPVAKCVSELDLMPPAALAHLLRNEAARRIEAALSAWHVGLWVHASEMLGLALGYLTAAARAEETAEAA